jgi:hypothetical protein
MQPYLDHIIILVSYQELQSLPAWIPKNFTVTPGGRHADGKTENKLICFEDGSYIEFIAFINNDPKMREGHVSILSRIPIIIAAGLHPNDPNLSNDLKGLGSEYLNVLSDWKFRQMFGHFTDDSLFSGGVIRSSGLLILHSRIRTGMRREMRKLSTKGCAVLMEELGE